MLTWKNPQIILHLILGEIPINQLMSKVLILFLAKINFLDIQICN